MWKDAKGRLTPFWVSYFESEGKWYFRVLARNPAGGDRKTDEEGVIKVVAARCSKAYDAQWDAYQDVMRAALKSYPDKYVSWVEEVDGYFVACVQVANIELRSEPTTTREFAQEVISPIAKSFELGGGINEEVEGE